MTDTPTTAGAVASCWRYPVKSMGGEEIDAALITERGIAGDRGYALVDRATGHVVSAKHPRKWSAVIACRAAFVAPARPDAPLPPVAITLPDGAVISSAEPEIDRVLSRLLDRDVTLVAIAPAAPTCEANRTPIDAPAGAEVINEEPMGQAAPAGTFFDYAPLHILTTATLAQFQALHPAGRFDVRRFRPNIVVAPTADAPDFVENGWLGQALAIGAEVRLRLIDPSPRCVVTTLAQGDLPRDPDILRTVTRHNAAASVTLAPGVVLPAVAGAYAAVIEGGTLRRGDTVRLGAGV